MGLTRTGIANYRNAITELSASADTWRLAADHIETAVDGYVSTITGTDWAGTAAEAAEESAYADRGVVYDAAGHLRTLARHADLGASNLRNAHTETTEAIDAAEVDGFAVDDELRIRDARRYDITTIRARNAALAEHSDTVNRAVEKLIAEDEETANTMTAHNNVASFTPARWRDDAVIKSGGHVQAVDYTTDSQVGPFPVPPSVKEREKPLPPAPPVPPPAPWEQRMADLEKRNAEQDKKITKLEENGHKPTVGGVLGALGTGCATGAASAAIAGAPTGPGEGVAIPGGCIIGGAVGLGGYLTGVWITNATEGVG
ncbi:hypothetical protein [Mycobacterium sp. DL440]|uniref:hypothetical protein n=1 Tax=Mycobacterium sp. DL440 TaxID=2675523 RepID=UPI001420671B|nr:hypothetical protein [Mycobacterium sp. DL440]